MSQVVRTTNQVINNALYLLGELGVGETPDAFMLNTGLDLINELLDKSSLSRPTLFRAISDLKKKKMIEIKKANNGSTRYFWKQSK